MTAKTNISGDRPRNRWRVPIWGTAALLLMVPLVAMQFTEEVNWDLPDFMFMGVMLTAACGTYELAARVTSSSAYRTAVAIAVAASFLLIWINLAVGIVGDEDNPANLMFGGVIAVAVAGALIARFEPAGMARAMNAAAIAQGLVAVIVLVMGHFTFVLAAFFVALWLLSAGLFRKAGRDQAPTIATH